MCFRQYFAYHFLLSALGERGVETIGIDLQRDTDCGIGLQFMREVAAG